MLDTPQLSLFSHVKPGDTPWRSDGLRDVFLYRDLGMMGARGRVIASRSKPMPTARPRPAPAGTSMSPTGTWC
jgi:hypothetical protein